MLNYLLNKKNFIRRKLIVTHPNIYIYIYIYIYIRWSPCAEVVNVHDVDCSEPVRTSIALLGSPWNKLAREIWLPAYPPRYELIIITTSLRKMTLGLYNPQVNMSLNKETIPNPHIRNKSNCILLVTTSNYKLPS